MSEEQKPRRRYLVVTEDIVIQLRDWAKEAERCLYAGEFVSLPMILERGTVAYEWWLKKLEAERELRQAAKSRKRAKLQQEKRCWLRFCSCFSIEWTKPKPPKVERCAGVDRCAPELVARIQRVAEVLEADFKRLGPD